jgi:hypothetical protein
MFRYELRTKMPGVLATQTTLNSDFLAVFWSLEIADFLIFSATIILKNTFLHNYPPSFFLK